uniref:DNA-directed RNA polymerase n=1 Tax=viral metagenome TaxID=1070528 RepID=A0A6C0F0R7_9ZZZZ
MSDAEQKENERRGGTYYGDDSDDDDSDEDDDDGDEFTGGAKRGEDDDDDEFVDEDGDVDEDAEERDGDGNEEQDEEVGVMRQISGEDVDEDADDDDDDELNENYLQKLDSDVKHNIIAEYHPELNAHSMDEVEASCTIIRDEKGAIIDPLHQTLPFVTRYEKARVIGERAKQINSGAKPFIEIEQTMIDGYLIALKEFELKKIPFIIRRPLPNGTSEYWRLADLEIIA